MVLVENRFPRIHYRLCGRQDGQVLVMLRGLGRSMRHWSARVIELLEPSFRLLLIDNRGVGRSDVPMTPYSTAAMADDLAAVLDHAQIARVHLFGMSLGGMIAQQFALRHGGRLDRLVLGCTMAGGLGAPRARFRDLWPALTGQLRGGRHAMVAEAKLLLSETFLRDNPQVVDHWADLQRQEPTAMITMANQVCAALRHNTSGQLDRITAPTLLISAEGDLLIPAENSHRLARGLTRAELAWLPGTAHDFATEFPDRTAEMVSEFLLRPLRADTATSNKKSDTAA